MEIETFFYCFIKYYAFVDTEEYLGDQLFIQQKVEVSFGKEFGKKGNDYLIIFCKVEKKDEKNFLKALDELEKKNAVNGAS